MPQLGGDEKAFRKGHKYFTLVNDLERSRVLYVAEDRSQASLDGFWETLPEGQPESIEAVAMDMWDPYVASVSEHVREGNKKIVYDKFHIAKHLGDAVDQVRRKENRTLRAAGDDRLTGTRYDWLRNPAAMEPADHKAFAELRQSGLKTARAWALKETANGIFSLSIRAAGAKTFSLVARLGSTQSAAPHAGSSQDLEATLREHHHLSPTPGHECCERIHQCQNPVGEVHGSRFPQQEEF